MGIEKEGLGRGLRPIFTWFALRNASVAESALEEQSEDNAYCVTWFFVVLIVCHLPKAIAKYESCCNFKGQAVYPNHPRDSAEAWANLQFIKIKKRIRQEQFETQEVLGLWSERGVGGTETQAPGLRVWPALEMLKTTERFCASLWY